jgi:hypothetical protein
MRIRRTSRAIGIWLSIARDPTKPRAPVWRFNSSAGGSPVCIRSRAGWHGGRRWASRCASCPNRRFPHSRPPGREPPTRASPDTCGSPRRPAPAQELSVPALPPGTGMERAGPDRVQHLATSPKQPDARRAFRPGGDQAAAPAGAVGRRRRAARDRTGGPASIPRTVRSPATATTRTRLCPCTGSPTRSAPRSRHDARVPSEERGRAPWVGSPAHRWLRELIVSAYRRL